jgi:hypothetical protein
MSSRRDAVHELEIGPELRLGTLELGPTVVGAVVAGSILAFDDKVTEQHTRDVMQSVLLAQLAATAKWDRDKDPANWYKTYQSTLEQIGWVVSASTAFTRYVSTTSRYTISTVITDTFRRRTTPQELALVTRTLDAFTRDQGSPAQFVWECPSHSGGIGNFQFGLVEEEDNGTVSVQLGRFTFDAKVHVTRLAFEEFRDNTNFRTSYVAMTLNEDVFGPLRDAITKKLESRYSGSVAPIELDSG